MVYHRCPPPETSPDCSRRNLQVKRNKAVVFLQNLWFWWGKYKQNYWATHNEGPTMTAQIKKEKKHPENDHPDRCPMVGCVERYRKIQQISEGQVESMPKQNTLLLHTPLWLWFCSIHHGHNSYRHTVDFSEAFMCLRHTFIRPKVRSGVRFACRYNTSPNILGSSSARQSGGSKVAIVPSVSSTWARIYKK